MLERSSDKGAMRARSFLLSPVPLVLAIACGPIYPNPPAGQQQGQPPMQAQQSGPPGGAADPWSAQPVSSSTPAPAPPARPAAPEAPGHSAGNSAAAKPAGALPDDMQALLDAHNRVRAKHCAAPLTWSPKLAAVAQGWANALRDQGCKFGHKPNNKYGENLAGGTSGTLDGGDVLGMWYDEVKLYAFPNGGFSMETGHFTQVVWRDTRQLGCARSTCKGMDLWVCEYDPPGNVQGQYRQQVLPTSCK
jgi:uncharacterized protein YkwD